MSNTANRNAFPYVNGPLVHTGMTLHQYFAGQAVAGLLSRDLEPNSIGSQVAAHSYVRREADPPWVAIQSLRIADAMCSLYDAREQKRKAL